MRKGKVTVLLLIYTIQLMFYGFFLTMMIAVYLGTKSGKPRKNKLNIFFSNFPKPNLSTIDVISPYILYERSSRDEREMNDLVPK